MHLNVCIDKCLCGSGRVLRDCCLKDCRPPKVTSKTTLSNLACYASALGDCSTSISREHYISEGVLKQIGDPITVGGFPWQRGKEKTVATKALTSKILCGRHNSALSGLDHAGIRFFERLRAGRFERPVSEAVICSKTNYFRGEMIELWMLKVLTGLIVSGNAPDQSGSSISVDLPPNWLGVLFDHQPMPTNWGLYMPCTVGHVFGGSRSNCMTVIYSDGILNGFIIILDHLGFVLVMNQPPVDKTGTLLEGCTYRPSEIVINSRLRQDILRIFWERPGDEICITIG